MAHYAVFFPNFLTAYAADAVAAISEAVPRAKAEYSENLHRLDALPAVVAAHMLGRPSDPSDDVLAEVICSGLRNRKREVREIILQNLIATASRDADSVRFFRMPEPIVRAATSIIDEASEEPALLSPACLAIDLLLNARLLLARGGKPTEGTNRALRAAGRLRAPHMWYATELIVHHEHAFPLGTPAGGPPQRSELLLRVAPAAGPERAYVQRQALIAARNAFAVFRAAVGIDRATPAIMSAGDATAALPKALAFLRYHVGDNLPTGSDARDLALPHDEAPFRAFLVSDLPGLLADEAAYARYRPSDLERELCRCVPFARFNDRTLAERILRANGEAAEAYRNELLSRGVTGFFSTITGVTVLVEVARALFAPSAKEPTTRHEPSPQDMARAQTAADAREAELGDALEREQAKHGDFVIEED